MHGKGEAPAIRILEEAGEDVGRFGNIVLSNGAARRTQPGQLGLCEHDIVKSLVFDDGKGGQAVMALMHGDERVSLHKASSGFRACRISSRVRRKTPNG